MNIYEAVAIRLQSAMIENALAANEAYEASLTPQERLERDAALYKVGRALHKQLWGDAI